MTQQQMELRDAWLTVFSVLRQTGYDFMYQEEIAKVVDVIRREIGLSSQEKYTQDIYVIEHGSLYSSDPWEIVGFCETNEEAQEFINKQSFPSLYHCTEVKHV